MGVLALMNLLIELLESMLRMRYFEEHVSKVYSDGIIRTPVHLGIGQEAVAAGVLLNKSTMDVVFSHHRCHNHFIGCGGSLKKLAAELLGKIDGVSGGRGGSVHLVDRDKGFLGTSAIMGESVSLAVGAGFGLKHLNKKGVSIVFFGDGAMDEGVVWESANFAAIHHVPVLFVCENNDYSAESTKELRMLPGTTYTSRFDSLGIQTLIVDGNNVLDVYQGTKKVLTEMRNTNNPFYLECNTYRWKEHVGPNEDSFRNRNYRKSGELEYWKERCPIKQLTSIIIERNSGELEKIRNLEKIVEEEINQAFFFAEKSKFPIPDTLTKNLFYEEINDN